MVLSKGTPISEEAVKKGIKSEVLTAETIGVRNISEIVISVEVVGVSITVCEAVSALWNELMLTLSPVKVLVVPTLDIVTVAMTSAAVLLSVREMGRGAEVCVMLVWSIISVSLVVGERKWRLVPSMTDGPWMKGDVLMMVVEEGNTISEDVGAGVDVGTDMDAGTAVGVSSEVKIKIGNGVTVGTSCTGKEDDICTKLNGTGVNTLISADSNSVADLVFDIREPRDNEADIDGEGTDISDVS